MEGRESQLRLKAPPKPSLKQDPREEAFTSRGTGMGGSPWRGGCQECAWQGRVANGGTDVLLGIPRLAPSPYWRGGAQR